MRFLGSLSKENLPPLWHLFLLDSVLAKVQISLIDETETNTADETGVTVSGATYIQELLPHVLRLTDAILHCTRWSLLHSMVDQVDSEEKYTLQDFEPLQEVLAILSARNTLTSSIGTEVNSLLPASVSAVLQQWTSNSVEECTWTPYLNDIIPSESYILKIVEVHVSTLSASNPFNVNASLKRILQCLVKFVCQHVSKTENPDTKDKAIKLLVSLTLDIRTEFLYETVSKTLDKLIGDVETDEHQKRIYFQILDNSYKLTTAYTSANTKHKIIDEKILHQCLKFYEKMLEKSAGKQALESFFIGEKDLVKVLMSASCPQMTQQYSTRVLHFFNKLFKAVEKSSTDPSLNCLCSSVGKLAEVESKELHLWLKHIILGPNGKANGDEDDPETKTNETNDNKAEKKSLVQENSQLLQSLTNFVVKQNSNISEEVAITILRALLPLGFHILSPPLEGVGFTELMAIMTMLADGGNGRGHIYLFPAAADWVKICKKNITQAESLEKLSDSLEKGKSMIMIESACCLFDYLGEVVNGLSANTSHISSFRALSPPWEGNEILNKFITSIQLCMKFQVKRR